MHMQNDIYIEVPFDDISPSSVSACDTLSD
uniref:Uncharacterized protein n=1 Tax=Anguilla anguilla TaxID=7936 RepID=A0A0E9VE60_ANGAN